MIGKIYNAPKRVLESGYFIVVGRDHTPDYNSLRKPWFLQVREWVDGAAVGPWIPVTLKEFMEWNPNATVTEQQRMASGNRGGTPELC